MNEAEPRHFFGGRVFSLGLVLGVGLGLGLVVG